jgi:O-antigen/teichoic acid export membrane protein
MIFMSDLMRYIQDRSFIKVAEAKRKIMTSTAVFIFPVAFFFIFFSREFIVLYLSEKYIDSYIVFIIFTMALLIRLQNYTDILILMKKSVYVLISFVVFMVLNIGLNLWLSGIWGIVGCALATIVSVYILAGMQLHFTVRQLNVRYTEYIDIKALVQILFFSAAWAAAIKWGINQLDLPLLGQFLLAGICTVPPLVIFLIKQKFLDISALEGLFGKIPYFGHKLYRLLA